MLNKVKLNKTKLFLLFLLFQILILALMVLTNYILILRGEKITVKVEPVDPRSLLQGDYVSLQYPFNTLDLNKIKHDFSPEEINGQKTIYLVFTKKGENFEPDFVTKDKQKTINKTYLKGKALYLTYPPLSKEEYFDQEELPPPSLLRAQWGIEQYFVPEGKGKAIEAKIREGIVYAHLALYRGKGRVIDLITATIPQY